MNFYVTIFISNVSISKGEYKIKLPDGRLQVVSYVADKYGFKPRISYVLPAKGLYPADDPIKKPNSEPDTDDDDVKVDIDFDSLEIPKPEPKLKIMPYPTDPPSNYVTPNPYIALTPDVPYPSKPSYSNHLDENYENDNPEVSFLSPLLHHAASSQTVYKALPIKEVHQTSSIGMVHKGTPIKNYKINYKNSKTNQDDAQSVTVTPKPESYVTPLPTTPKTDEISYIPPLNYGHIERDDSSAYTDDMVTY